MASPQTRMPVVMLLLCWAGLATAVPAESSAAAPAPPPTRWICDSCSHIYDAAKDDPSGKNTPFPDLPSTWVCPVCGAPKSSYGPQLLPGSNETVWVHTHEEEPPPAAMTLFQFTEKSKPWVVTNDPVMGGVSYSKFQVVDGVGVWAGEVKTVPKLHAPGTCQSQSRRIGGLLSKGLNASQYDAIEITLVSKGALKHFQVEWGGEFVPEPPGSPHYRKKAYKAPFTVSGTGAEENIIVPMKEFTSSYSTYSGECHDHGAVCCSPQHPEVCPSTKTRSSITEVGIDAQGTLGKFELHIMSIRAINQH